MSITQCRQGICLCVCVRCIGRMDDEFSSRVRLVVKTFVQVRGLKTQTSYSEPVVSGNEVRNQLPEAPDGIRLPVLYVTGTR
jgi:hypothetical protein